MQSGVVGIVDTLGIRNGVSDGVIGSGPRDSIEFYIGAYNANGSASSNKSIYIQAIGAWDFAMTQPQYSLACSLMAAL